MCNFNGPESQLLSFKYSKVEQEIFFKPHQVIPMIIFDNLHYNLYHLIM